MIIKLSSKRLQTRSQSFAWTKTTKTTKTIRDPRRRSRQILPRVTIIRPCKGLDPFLKECLTATFQQDYPLRKLAIFFCIHSRADPCFRLLQELCKQFPAHNTRIFIEDETLPDELVQGLGPNPKVRNMSAAYRSALSDLVWILDCNVWVQ